MAALSSVQYAERSVRGTVRARLKPVDAERAQGGVPGERVPPEALAAHAAAADVDPDGPAAKVGLELPFRRRRGWQAGSDLRLPGFLGGDLLPDPGEAHDEPRLQDAEAGKVGRQIGHMFESSAGGSPRCQWSPLACSYPIHGLRRAASCSTVPPYRTPPQGTATDGRPHVRRQSPAPAASFTAISTSNRFCPVAFACSAIATCRASAASSQGRHASALYGPDVACSRGRVRRTLELDEFVGEFDCHGRILGGGYDSGPQPLGEQLLVLLRARAAGQHERPDRVVDLRDRAGCAGASVVGIMSHRISGRTHRAVGLRP
jgi:hypothetical protein